MCFRYRVNANDEAHAIADDPNYSSVSSGPPSKHSIPPTQQSNDAQHFLPAHLKYTTPDQALNPVPPYMPIQGTRRTNNASTDSKKKKSKDSKCTQQ